MRLVSFAVAAFALFAQSATAAFVVVANHTDKPVEFLFSPKGQGDVRTTLKPGESRAIPCGKNPTARHGGEKSAPIQLEPYGGYVFVTEKGKVELKGIEFAGKPVPKADVSDSADRPADLKIPVRLLMDDANPFARAKWEPDLKNRFREASDIVHKACGVRFELTELGEWKSDPDLKDPDAIVSDLEEKEKPGQGGIVIGYSCRRLAAPKGVTLLGPTRGPLKPVILLRDGVPPTAADQLEVLVQELAHYLGGVRIPDPTSVMRPTVGDGKANLVAFEIRFDPVNVLLLNLWAEELRTGKVKKWTDLRPEAKARLARIYGTLDKSHAETPLAVAYKDLIAGEIPADAADPDPLKVANPRPARPDPAPTPANLSNKEKAIRRVVRGMTLRAVDNAAKPENGADARLTGDALTADLVRTAANVAAGEEESVRLAAFAVGLGLALDDSTTLRDNPLLRAMCRAIEPDADRKERIAALGTPTVRSRRDLCQHFAVSIALAELIGPKLAEQAGVAKEFADMNGTSGFSFTDLAADFAGVEFHTRLKKDSTLLEKVRDTFTVADFVPELTGLADGLTKDRFASVYGTSGDDRYKAAVADLRARVEACNAYKK